MFCVKCGHQINDDAKFCPECGSSQSVASEPKENEVNEETSTDGFNFHAWIVENGLESSESILKGQDLDTLDVLMSITESDLDKIGIDGIGTKRKILNGIQKLKTSASTYTATKEMSSKEGIPTRCPNCGEIWGLAKENTGAGNTLGKALIGGLLLGPLGAVGGAAFGNKTTTYICNKCGFKKEYKSSLVKNAATGIKNMFK